MESSERTHESLRHALRELADAETPLEASAVVEARLRAHVRQLASPPRHYWRESLATAAAIVFFVLVWRFVPAHPPEQLASASFGGAIEVQADEFLPLPYAHLPTTEGQVVRMAVPRESLTSFGLDPGSSDGPDVVLADVFVGEDGIARAVRFIQPFD